MPDRLMKIRPFDDSIPIYIDAPKHCAAAYVNSNFNLDEDVNVKYEENVTMTNGEVNFTNIVAIKATRDINKNEEILVNYGNLFNFDEDVGKKNIISIDSAEERAEEEINRVERIQTSKGKFYFLKFVEVFCIDGNPEKDLSTPVSDEFPEQFTVTVEMKKKSNGFKFVFIFSGQEYETRSCPTCQKSLDKNNYNCDKCDIWLHCWCGKVIEDIDEGNKIMRCYNCARGD